MDGRVIHCMDCKVEVATEFYPPTGGTKLTDSGRCRTCYERAVKSFRWSDRARYDSSCSRDLNRRSTEQIGRRALRPTHWSDAPS